MLKLLILFIFIGPVGAGKFVRIKTTVGRDQRPDDFHRYFSTPQQVNQTLILADGDNYYTGIIHIGSPSQQFVVNFDTGSPSLWIAGPSCKYDTKDDCTSQTHRYDPTKSSSSKDLHKDFFTSYEGRDHAAGKLVSDIVGLTSSKTGAETSASFPFAYATDIDSSYRNVNYDGRFGLSFSWPGKNDQSYIEYLRDNKIFDTPIFTVWLNRNTTKKSISGEIIFGGKHPDHCDEGLVTVKAPVQKPWWSFNIDGSFMDGKKISGKTTTVTDTTAPYIYAPMIPFYAIARKYPLYFDIETQKPIVFKCDEHKDIKLELTLQIDGKPFKFTAADLLYQHGNDCMLTLGYWKDSRWILGNTFAKKYCQIHNYLNETLTFAESK